MGENMPNNHQMKIDHSVICTITEKITLNLSNPNHSNLPKIHLLSIDNNVKYFIFHIYFYLHRSGSMTRKLF